LILNDGFSPPRRIEVIVSLLFSDFERWLFSATADQGHVSLFINQYLC
jgi:hypothetical protein